MECKSCPINKLCPHYGVTTADVTGSDARYKCPDGYVCLGAAIHESKNDNVTVRLCSIGYFCSLSTSTSNTPEEPCPINYYNKVKGQTQCLPCPAGFVCNKLATVDPVPCKVGFYCPQFSAGNVDISTSGELSGATRTTQIPCPAGTFNPNQYASNVNQCWPCTPGKYCLEGSEAPKGICDQGYVCTGSQPGPKPR